MIAVKVVTMRRSFVLITLLVSSLAAAHAAERTFSSSAGPVRVETVVGGLQYPWSLAFLPDRRMLVTERPGRLRIVTADGKLSPPVAGMPKVYAQGQGGLLDVVVDRNFSQNRLIYFCFAEPFRSGARTALARARLADDGYIENLRIIFRQDGPLSKGSHFGCRIVQMPDRNLFLTMGDHLSERDEAQNLTNHLGKIVRVTPDGSAPQDNPFVKSRNAKPEIWSYGHRNSQGAAINPASGKLWMVEHGPRGGDELNIPQAGKNYGWPVIGFGVDYNGAKIHASTSKPGMEQPVKQWTPVISPSGMAFYTGSLFPKWKNNLLIGGLSSQTVVRLELSGEKVVKEERLLQEMQQRIRDVRAGPDGALWLLTDGANGSLLRVTPAS